MGLSRLRPTKSVPVFAALKDVQLVDGWIARLIWDSFRVHGLDQTLGARASELVPVHVEDVGVLTVSCATGVQFLRRDPGNRRQQFVEKARILMAAPRLAVETRQLSAQYCSLPFAQAVIRSVDEVAIEPFARHAAAIMHATSLSFESIIIRDDDPALPCGHQLAGLKT